MSFLFPRQVEDLVFAMPALNIASLPPTLLVEFFRSLPFRDIVRIFEISPEHVKDYCFSPDVLKCIGKVPFEELVKIYQEDSKRVKKTCCNYHILKNHNNVFIRRRKIENIVSFTSCMELLNQIPGRLHIILHGFRKPNLYVEAYQEMSPWGQLHNFLKYPQNVYYITLSNCLLSFDEHFAKFPNLVFHYRNNNLFRYKKDLFVDCTDDSLIQCSCNELHFRAKKLNGRHIFDVVVALGKIFLTKIETNIERNKLDLVHSPPDMENDLAYHEWFRYPLFCGVIDT